LSVLNNFPFDFLVFNKKADLKWVSIKENPELLQIFKVQANYSDIVGPQKDSFDLLIEQGLKFSCVQNVENKNYRFTHFCLSGIDSEEKLFGVFVNATDSTNTIDDLNELCFSLFRYFSEGEKGDELEIKRSTSYLNDSLVSLLSDEIKSLGPEITYKLILDYVSLHYYFDSLKYDIQERKNIYRYINTANGNLSSSSYFSNLLVSLEENGVKLKDFFKVMGPILGHKDLDEIIHYFCEINEHALIDLKIDPMDELFQFINNAENNVSQDYPFFYQRLESFEHAAYKSGVIPKLLLWEKVNSLFRRCVK